MKSTLRILIIAFVFFPSVILSQGLDEFEAKTYSSEKGELAYRILSPVDIQKDKKYPLIIFLHGSGERGSDNKLQLKHGADLFLNMENRQKFPAFVVFPQCKSGESWHNVIYDLSDPDTDFKFPKRTKENIPLRLVEGLMAELINENPIDMERIYVGGLSMGGMGTFEMVLRNPNTFAAAFPICGGADPRVARRLRKTPFWIFHGLDDNVIPPELSIQIHDALEKKAADVKISLYEGVGHDSWTNAFNEPDLLPWIFSKTRKLKD